MVIPMELFVFVKSSLLTLIYASRIVCLPTKLLNGCHRAPRPDFNWLHILRYGFYCSHAHSYLYLFLQHGHSHL